MYPEIVTVQALLKTMHKRRSKNQVGLNCNPHDPPDDSRVKEVCRKLPNLIE